ncbi:substrate-binding periplasmic protein [Roseateles cavernae]|uniref:substrate-binding periplasmic protein n=1 Tax=Roseateles cavernae TaxID=3153578 RepID=UPI0032E41315
MAGTHATLGLDYRCHVAMLLHRRSLLLLGTVSCLSGRGVARGAALEVQSHYDFAPFQTGPGEGLNYDLVAWLRQSLLAEELEVRLSGLPRRRLDLLMRAPDWRGLVPWVVPAWFGDAGMTRFVWSAPVIEDADLVLSHKNRALDYDGPASLRGLRLGGVLGHSYVEVDPLVVQGLVRREDASDTASNLRKLLRGRVDVVFLAQSGWPWWLRQMPELTGQIHVAPKARARYARRMLLSPRLPPELRHTLLALLAKLGRDQTWQRYLARYGLQDVPQHRIAR